MKGKDVDIEARNRMLSQAYQAGEPMTSISKRTGISCTQLSRIFRSLNVKRAKYELDQTYFEANKGKSHRQMSEETGLPLKRITHLYRIAYNKPLSKGKTNFTDLKPIIDVDLINDKRWLYEQYITNNLGTPTIARMLASKASTVIKKLKEHGIPLRTVSESSKILEKRPDREWLQKHYVDLKWSITKCADAFNTGFNAIYSALVENGFETRSASEQHVGELNEFYGKEHSPEIAEYCASVGSKYGSLYWVTGDVPEKVANITRIAKEIWSDPIKRSEQSKRITELCMNGGCNSKQILYVRSRDEKSFVFRSTWEHAIAVFLENCGLVQDWDYEALSIPYEIDGVLKNYIIDFKIDWKDGTIAYVECKNSHLLKEEKEQKKIQTAKSFLLKNKSNLIVISDIKDLKDAEKFKPIDYKEHLGARYSTGLAYKKQSDLQNELFRHYLVERVTPWQNLEYSNEELIHELDRLKNENIDQYVHDGNLRTTVPSRYGMPGRALILQFQKHFLNVVINDKKPLIEAFNDKWVVYRSILQSMDEGESLSLERLLREINFHFTKYGRTSHFAPGFARALIRFIGMSGKRMFDPCCGWGGRLIGAWLEGCEYRGTDISPLTFNGLIGIADFIGIDRKFINSSCLDADWDGDFILTSPPFYDVEEYIGGEQPWKSFKSRSDWVDGFITPFIDKVGNTPCALYLDERTKDDYALVRKFDRIVNINHRRHARRQVEHECLCLYNI